MPTHFVDMRKKLRGTGFTPSRPVAVRVTARAGRNATVVCFPWSRFLGSAASLATWRTRTDLPPPPSRETVAIHVR